MTSDAPVDGPPAPEVGLTQVESTPVEAPPPPEGCEFVHGKLYMRDAKGGLVPRELIRQQDLLRDGLVRDMFAKATVMAERLLAFKLEAMGEIDTFMELLAERYKAKPSAKGNVSLPTVDGLMQVQIQVADLETFGAELQVAKSLFEECLEEWSADTRAEMRSLVLNAFRGDKEGQINRGRLFLLLRTESEDPRWIRAQGAIRDSIQIIGSKRYIRFRFRRDHQAAWSTLSLDVATAG
jgi:hypothetical protein